MVIKIQNIEYVIIQPYIVNFQTYVLKVKAFVVELNKFGFPLDRLHKLTKFSRK
jgi:hypothetical protein